MQLFIVLFLFLCTLASLFLLYYHKCNRKYGNSPLPPGKMGWPVVGESWEFVSTALKGLPEKFIFNRLSKYSPSQIFKTSIIGEKMIVMYGPSSNKFLFSNEGKLLRIWMPRTIDKIFQHSKQTTKKMRSLGSFNLLKPDNLRRYIPIMDTYAKLHFASEWEGKDEVKVYPMIKRYTFCLACRLFLGMESTQIANLEGHFNDLTAGFFSFPINLPGTRFYRAIKASKIIKRELIGIIKQRKDLVVDDKAQEVSPTHDILSQLLLTPDEDGRYMSEMDIASSVMGLIVGGHDNVSSLGSFVVKYLAEFPHVYDAVYKEQMEIARSKAPKELLSWEDIQKMKYTWNMACEVLRLSPPGSGSFKEVLDDFMYEGFLVPKGWKIHWSLAATHKDPQYFPEPEKFDPSRFEGQGPAPYTYIPFGGGPRMCPGKEYTRLEILVFTHNLVKRFKWEKVIPDEKLVINLAVVPAKGLPVRLRPHPES